MKNSSSKNKFCFIDFEFNNTLEESLNLVCGSFATSVDYEPQTIWLHKDKMSQAKLKAKIEVLIDQGYIFVAYAVEAEARSFLALGIDPLQCKWIDLYLEYRCLLNHNHTLAYGDQLIGGRLKKTRPPSKNKWNLTEDDKRAQDMSKPEYNLAAAIYKLLGKRIGVEFKDETRDIIISSPKEFTSEQKEQILVYCESDIKYLPQLLKSIVAQYRILLKYHPKHLQTLMGEMLERGEYAARTAHMVSKGYPIDYDATKAFSASVPDMLWTVQNEINSLFPEIQPFEKDGKRYIVWKQKKTRDWVAAQKHRNWMKTKPSKTHPKGQLSLSQEAFKRHYDYRHNYPKDNFGAQIVRYLTLRQNLNGFLPKKPGALKKSFWDYVGTDRRARPYFGIFGSQSSRSQPSATGFIPLKSAWMRCLIRPPTGKAICSIDYSSEEFLLSALFYVDMNMIKAYHSGDPYVWFAKEANGMPSDGTKKSHPEIREKFKSTTLGLSYDMTEFGLAKKLTVDLKRKVTETEAKRLINLFNRVFRTQYIGKQRLLRKYLKDGHLKLPCGWYMWGDNQNHRSVGNLPIQGMGASIMRKAVKYAQDKGLDVIYTLHDALYIEFDVDDVGAINKLADSMHDAFKFYFAGSNVERYANIRMEADVWSDDLGSMGELESLTFSNGELPIKTSNIYIDPRGVEEYEQFKKYLEPLDYSALDI